MSGERVFRRLALGTTTSIARRSRCPRSVRREKREAIRSPEGQGHVQGACRQDRELSGRVEPGREEVRLGRKSIPRRDDRAEEGRRAEGRQGDRAQAQLASLAPRPEIGYALSSEECRPEDLVRSARMAEERGFAFALI